MRALVFLVKLLLKIAVVPNLTKESAQACTDEALRVLAGCGCETVLKTDLFTSQGVYQERVEDSLLSCDLFIAIGGDGTFRGALALSRQAAGNAACVHSFVTAKPEG